MNPIPMPGIMLESTTKLPAGVWMVAQNRSEGDDIIPFASELDALRYVNSEFDKRAWFVPFGKSLHDTILAARKPGAL